MDIHQQKKYCIDVMKTSRACYLSTIGDAGFPETRAMLNLRNSEAYPGLKELFERHNDDFMIYFTTNASSSKIGQINSNAKISVYYCNPENWQGVMANGVIEIASDLNIKKSLWQPGWEMYYHKGFDDPDYTVLRFKPALVKAYGNLSVFCIKPGE